MLEKNVVASVGWLAGWLAGVARRWSLPALVCCVWVYGPWAIYHYYAGVVLAEISYLTQQPGAGGHQDFDLVRNTVIGIGSEHAGWGRTRRTMSIWASVRHCLGLGGWLADRVMTTEYCTYVIARLHLHR